MPIASDNPTVVPATSEKTYNLWWIEKLVGETTNKGNSTQSFAISFVFRKARFANNAYEFSEHDNPVVYRVDDVFALAATNPDVATILGGLITLAGTLAKADGAIQ
jgi:hypothetical protein